MTKPKKVKMVYRMSCGCDLPIEDTIVKNMGWDKNNIRICSTHEDGVAVNKIFTCIDCGAIMVKDLLAGNTLRCDFCLAEEHRRNGRMNYQKRKAAGLLKKAVKKVKSKPDHKRASKCLNMHLCGPGQCIRPYFECKMEKLG